MTSSWILTAFVTLCLYVVSISADAAVDAKCEDATIQTCDACIQAHPKCAWCLEGEEYNSNIKRCRSFDKFEELGGCKDGSMEYPISTIENTQNTELSTAGEAKQGEKVVQLKPQKIHLELRKGETKKFNVTFRKVSDYPVDLYYVMDLSNSMKDDLQTLQNLGKRLAQDIKSNVTQNIQLGFGTFVDKVMMPFASTVPAQLRNPCFKNQEGGECAPPFGFKHQQKISDDVNRFENAVTNTKISGNIDSPEGGFDALMQIAVCTEEIGWRNESTHLVVFTTDASFHMALDGKLAAILEMNDLGCHMQKGANAYLPDDIVYSKSQEQDYPSIGQLRYVFNKYKIQPIFAVTGEVKPLYDGLRQLIPNSHVDQLAADSSNIIGIIKDAYNNLKGKLEMTLPDKPKEIDMKYRVLCPKEAGWKEQSLRCDNITIGSEVVYEFEMKATQCPEGEVAPMTFTSSSLQEAVQITIGFKCDCQCTGTPTPSSPDCSTNGSLVCGQCECDDQHEGAKCQCVRESKNVALVEKCKKDGTADEVCEDNGQCECGNCTCNEGYSGTYCECSNKGCPKDGNGLLCGGPTKGSCHNCNNDGKCKCKGGWELDEKLSTCTCHKDQCRDTSVNDSKECSNNGQCHCSHCICDKNGYWDGEYCQTCIHPNCKTTKPICEGADGGKFVKCALCVNQAQSRGKNVEKECNKECLGVEQKIVEQIPDCQRCSDDNCRRVCIDLNTTVTLPKACTVPLPQSECDIKFEIVWFKSVFEFGILVKQYNKEEDCNEPINPIIIVLPIVAGIVLLGLLALAAWKIYQTIRDKKEWENFEKEMKQSRWTKDINPVFVNPSATFENPSYGGDM